jgi:glycosyltransferase involved in cell wall biosynthesis
VDDTPAVLTRWEEKLRGQAGVCLRWIRQANGGVSAALNHGLIESAGEFIQFLDSDDILFPEKMRLQIASLQSHPEAGLAFSEEVELVAGKSEEPPSLDQAAVVESANFYCQENILRVQAVYRRQTCRDAGPWSEDLKLSEDREYNFRILLVNDRVVHLPGKLCARRAHPTGRLMDIYYQPVGLRIRLRGLNAMAELARSENCLGNRKLIGLLAQRYTGLATDALRRGDSEVVSAAARACRALPISLSRRVKLAVYQLFNVLPPAVYQTWAPLWVNMRRRLPGRRQAKSE